MVKVVVNSLLAVLAVIFLWQGALAQMGPVRPWLFYDTQGNLIETVFCDSVSSSAKAIYGYSEGIPFFIIGIDHPAHLRNCQPIPFEELNGDVTMNVPLIAIDTFGSEFLLIDKRQSCALWSGSESLTPHGKGFKTTGYLGKGYVNYEGKTLLPAIYDTLTLPDKEGYLKARLGEQWTLLNEETGVGATLKAELLSLGNATNAWFPFQQSYGQGYMSEEGWVRISPRYNFLGRFCRGRAVISMGGRFGVIDTLDQFVVRPFYDSILAYQSEATLAYNDTLAYILDLEGKEVFSGPKENINALESDIWRIRGVLGYGLYHAKYGKVLPPVHTYIEQLAPNIYIATLNDKYLLITKSGKSIISNISFKPNYHPLVQVVYFTPF